jgi:hypothetical protein
MISHHYSEYCIQEAYPNPWFSAIKSHVLPPSLFLLCWRILIQRFIVACDKSSFSVIKSAVKCQSSLSLVQLAYRILRIPICRIETSLSFLLRLSRYYFLNHYIGVTCSESFTISRSRQFIRREFIPRISSISSYNDWKMDMGSPIAIPSLLFQNFMLS